MRVFGLLLGGASLLNYLRIRSLWTALLFVPRLFAGSLVPLTGAFGLLVAWRGWKRRDWLAALSGGLAAVLASHTIRRVTAQHDGFETAFGDDWRSKLTPVQRAMLLKRRWSLWMPRPRPARLDRDCCFGILAGSRNLLCDVWQPPWDVPRSELAMIFLHGSAWHFGDKDMGTATFFSHLAQQGHVIVDLAYRLAPETDVYGQVNDALRAVAWLKANADRYHINPERIVLAGASAGAHLALLAAYLPDDDRFRPEDVKGDLSVRGVISIYGPVDLRLVYTNGQRIYQNNPLVLNALESVFHVAGVMQPDEHLTSPESIMRNIVGGLPDDVPEIYELAAPLNQIGPGCPPTLLLHGAADWLVPVEGTRQLYGKLRDAGVQAVYVELPYTDHGYDLITPRLSPANQAAFYDIERFLALLV